MMPFVPVSFDELLARHQERHLALAKLLLLSWVAACDGQVATEEERRLLSMNEGLSEALLPLMDIAKSRDLPSIGNACEIVRRQLPRDQRKPFYCSVIRIAASDSLLRPSENAVLRFLADVLGLSPEQVNVSFREILGSDLPSFPDLSQPKWWKERGYNGAGSGSSESGGKGSSGSADSRRRSAPGYFAHGVDIERIKALAVLGLGEESTAGDIRSAYRRLAHVHHPDRYAALGTDAITAANESFRRIQAAYEFLTRHA